MGKALVFEILGLLRHSMVFCLFISITSMYFYLVINENVETGIGIKNAINLWLRFFKSSKWFRIVFFLIYSLAVVVFKTLIYREIRLNHFSHFVGHWWLYRYDQVKECIIFNDEAFKNILLLIPSNLLFL